jgi:hypothetical protein
MAAGGAAGAAAGGAPGAGGAGSVILPDFFLTFDADLEGVALHGEGFSPGVGGSLGPAIFAATTLVWEADTGNPGGAAKMSVPLSVAAQQADVSGSFTQPANLAGYELTADVKIIATGDVGECPTVWMYVYSTINGYANDASGEPSMGVTNHLTVDEWTEVRLDLDGPYGFHSTNGFTPQDVILWGMQFNTWGCPP